MWKKETCDWLVGWLVYSFLENILSFASGYSPFNLLEFGFEIWTMGVILLLCSSSVCFVSLLMPEKHFGSLQVEMTAVVKLWIRFWGIPFFRVTKEEWPSDFSSTTPASALWTLTWQPTQKSMRGGTRTIRIFVRGCSFVRLTPASPQSPSASTSESGLLLALQVQNNELFLLFFLFWEKGGHTTGMSG